MTTTTARGTKSPDYVGPAQCPLSGLVPAVRGHEVVRDLPPPGGPSGPPVAAGQPIPAAPQINPAVPIGAAGLGTALVGVLTVFSVGRWTTAQAALVAALVTTAVAFVTALTTHVWPGPKKQPVAVASSFTALVAAGIGWAAGFGYLHWNQQQIVAVEGVVPAVVAVVSGLIVHSKVSPVDQQG